MLGYSDEGGDALDKWVEGGVCVSLSLSSGGAGLVSEVATQTVAENDGPVVSGSADQGGDGEVESVGGGQAGQEDGGLFHQGRAN